MTKKKAISPTGIAKTNPRIDVAKLKEAQAVLRDLRRQGAEESKYDLASPFDRRYSQERRARHEIQLDLRPHR